MNQHIRPPRADRSQFVFSEPGAVNRLQYGQNLRFPPPWRAGETRTVLSAKLPEAKVNSVMLSLNNPDTGLNSYNFVWRIRAGAGGGTIEFVIDAQNAQQINFPASSIDVDLECQEAVPGLFGSPPSAVQAIAFLGEYPVASSPAQLTRYFTVAAAAGPIFPIPVGARGWRIAGPRVGTASCPFQAAVIYNIRTPAGGTAQDSFIGTELEALKRTGDFIPLPSNARGLAIVNGTALDIEGGIIWQLDL